MLRLLTAFAFCFCLTTGASALADDASQAGSTVSYARDVRPIFQQHCVGCHQPAKAGGELVMTAVADMLKPGKTQLPGIVPGEPDDSEIVVQIEPVGDVPAAMPKGKPALAKSEVDLVRRWIAEGAHDDSPAQGGALVDAKHPPVYRLAPVVSALDYSPDGQLLAVSGYHEVLLHKPDGSELIARLVGLSERIESLAFSPDGKLLAVTGGSPGRFGEIQIWDVAKRQLVLSQSLTYDTIYGVSWTPDGTRIAFGCADNTLRAIDVATGEQVLFQGAHSDWVLGTTFSKDASHLVSVSRDMSMKLTEFATQRFVDNITSITPGALKGGLIAVEVRPEKDEVACGGADGVPKLYQIYRTKDRVIGDDFNLIRQFDAMPGRIYATRFNIDGSRLAVGSSDGATGDLRVYQVDDGKLISKAQGQIAGVYSVAYRPDGGEVAAGGFDGVVRQYDVESGTLLREFVPVPLAADSETVSLTP